MGERSCGGRRRGVLAVRHAAGVVASGFGLVVRFSLRAGSEEAFDRLVSRTVALIGEREPGTLMYVVHEFEDVPAARVFYELLAF